MNYKTFLLVPTGFSLVHLRRYATGSSCPGALGYHNAMGGELGEFKHIERADGTVEGYEGLPQIAELDPRWPEKCACGYVFGIDDTRQLFKDCQYRREDTGELMTLRAAPPGAIWRARWMEPCDVGADGHCYVCRMPGGHDWMIDGRASNCTMPEDKEHKCWVRKGVAPNFTVGKEGKTCAAGAGSIQVPGWHGFLRNGVLEEC